MSLPWSSSIEYCRTTMGGLKEEQFRVLYLNGESEILAEEVIQEGTVNQTVVYPRKIMELALKHKASGLILVHNHPSGNPNPSVSDRELTRSVTRISRAPNLTVHDHLIISRHGFFASHRIICCKGQAPRRLLLALACQTSRCKPHH